MYSYFFKVFAMSFSFLLFFDAGSLVTREKNKNICLILSNSQISSFNLH